MRWRRCWCGRAARRRPARCWENRKVRKLTPGLSRRAMLPQRPDMDAMVQGRLSVRGRLRLRTRS